MGWVPQLGLALLGFFELPEAGAGPWWVPIWRASAGRRGWANAPRSDWPWSCVASSPSGFAGFALDEPLADLDPAQQPAAEIGQDVELTLSALGYSAMEIRQALAAVAAAGAAVTPEDWIGACLAWLAQHGQAPEA